MKRGILLITIGVVLLAGCGGGEGGDAVTQANPPGGGKATGVGDGAGGVKLEEIGQFDQPLYVTQPPGGGDLYVVEQGGRVWAVSDDGRVQGQPFLDVSSEVIVGGEQGLLSLAFAPDYEQSGLVYVYFTGNDLDQHVVEFKASEDGEMVDPGSARELLRMEDFAPNHNGGLLLFGPDGKLYIGTGDGGIGDDVRRQAQDLSSRLGKILRIDPAQSGDKPYTVPADNPFVNRPGARPEIYSYGLRNPWRFSFDRETQALTIADVGQSGQEEIDQVAAGGGSGANFGWSAFEGTNRFNEDQRAPDAIPPILTYPTGEGGSCAITGGYVVRDPELTSLLGRYVYGDYCEGELRSLIATPGGARDDRQLGLSVPNLSSFGEDVAGHVYATSLNGPVYRLAPD